MVIFHSYVSLPEGIISSRSKSFNLILHGVRRLKPEICWNLVPTACQIFQNAAAALFLKHGHWREASARPKNVFVASKRVQALFDAAPFFIKRMYLMYFGEALMKPILFQSFSTLFSYFRMLRVLRRLVAPNHFRWTRKVVIAAIAPRTLLFNAHVPNIHLHQVTWLHLLSRVNSQEKTIAQLESPCAFFKCLRLFFYYTKAKIWGPKRKSK